MNDDPNVSVLKHPVAPLRIRNTNLAAIVILAAIPAFLVVGGCAQRDEIPNHLAERVMKERLDGFEVPVPKVWIESFERGQNILKEILDMTDEERRAFDVSTYRDEIVTFAGGGARPGATNDLTIENGFYIRVVNKSGKDLRPATVAWGTVVHGKIMQVFVENKIIVLDVEDDQWIAYVGI